MEARKDDGGKLRFDLIPIEPLRRLAEVYTIGAKKYSDRNWEKGLQWGRIYSALQRHATAWWGGERNDPVDGQHHLASVAWAALALMEYERTHTELDDRPKPRPKWLLPKGSELYGEIIEFHPGRNPYKQGTDPTDDDLKSRWIDPKKSTGEHGGV